MNNGYEPINTHLIFNDGIETCSSCGAGYKYYADKGDYYDLCDNCTDRESQHDIDCGKYSHHCE